MRLPPGSGPLVPKGMPSQEVGRRDLGVLALEGSALAVGLAAGLSGWGSAARAAGQRPEPGGQAALWAADRAGHALYGLRADGTVVGRVEVGAPTEVRPRVGHGAFVRSSLDRRLEGRARWLEWTGTELRPALSPPVSVPGWGGASPAAVGALGVTVCRADSGGKTWVLRASAGPSTRLERWCRAPSLQERWRCLVSRPLPFTAVALAPADHAAEDAVWVAGDRAPRVLKIGPTGRVIHGVELEGVDGMEDALAIPAALGGGVWLAACGALVRLDERGHRRPGQGGFAHLVSLAADPSIIG